MSLSETSGCVLKCGGWICLIVGHVAVFLSVSLSGVGGHVLECGRWLCHCVG